MFAKKPKTLLILYPNSLRVYYGKEGDVSQLDFPKDLINNLEVLNPRELSSLINSSLLTSGLKPQEALLLISSDVLEQKIINSSDQAVLEDETNKFFENTPFTRETLSRLILHGRGQLFLYATSKALWQIIVTEFENLGWEIAAVSPAIFYENVPEIKILEPKEVRRILDSFESSPGLSFMGSSSDSTKDLTTSSPKQSKNIWLTGGLFVVFLVVLLGAFLTMPGSKSILSFQKPLPQTSPSPMPSELPSPSPSAVAKTDLKVQVLNGSGVVGQAGKLRDQMASLGFNLIDTGNSLESSSQTIISFSKRVFQKIQDELLVELKKTFPDIESTQITSGEYDISIVTGK